MERNLHAAGIFGKAKRFGRRNKAKKNWDQNLNFLWFEKGKTKSNGSWLNSVKQSIFYKSKFQKFVENENLINFNQFRFNFFA